MALSLLLQFKAFADALPFNYCLFFHSIFCASLATDLRDRYLLSYVVSGQGDSVAAD